METEILSQGTEVRVVDPGAAVVATVAQTGAAVTVSQVGHGRKAGDRIEVLTSAEGEFIVGRHTVLSAATDAFVFTAPGSATVDAATAITYKPMYALTPKSIGGFGGTRNVIDASNLSNKSKRKRPGMRDNGQMQMGFNFNPANEAHNIVRAALDSGAYLETELQFTDEGNTFWATRTFVSAFTLNVAMDTTVEASCTLEVDGDIDEYTGV